MRSIPTIYPLGLLVGVALGVGCTNFLANHCVNLDGDQTCMGRGGGYCNSCVMESDGCTNEKPSDGCYFAGPGEGSSTSDTTADGGITTEETTLEPSTESGVTTGPLPCMSDKDCDDRDGPFCGISGECVVACDEATNPNACAVLDPGFPVCVGGVCVQCTMDTPNACSGKTPVCNDANNTCVACTAHDQCGKAACNLFTGACLPDKNGTVVTVPDEFPTLTDAVAAYPMEAAGYTIVISDTSVYDDAITISKGRTVAFLAASRNAPLWGDTPGNSGPAQLTVEGAVVIMDGIRISNNNNSAVPALAVNGGQVWVDRGRLILNVGGAIVAATGTELVLRNSFIGDSIVPNDTVQINDSMATILYSTIATGNINPGDLFPVSCKNANLVIRNSLLVSLDAAPSEVNCTDTIANISNSASDNLLPGPNNLALGDFFSMGGEWFDGDSDGDLHLNGLASIVNETAQWQAGDPTTDIDGDLRPAIAGTPDYAGADLIP